jgi:hypothetical protein
VPWRGPEHPDDFPSLGWHLLDWWADHLPSPRDPAAELIFTDEQALQLIEWYRLDPLTGKRVYRRGYSRRSKGWGKSPVEAAKAIAEFRGPVRFAGWDANGEPVGRPWGCMGDPRAWVQIGAISEDQTDNIYRVLRPMIDDGPLTEVMPKTGEEFIRIGTRGRIDTVSSNAKSRLGQQVSFVAQDETGIWTKSNGMIELAHAQRRGLAGMGGRTEETTNAWNPAEESIAQLTAESKSTDIFRLHTQAPSGLSYRSKSERRKIHKIVYNGCPWVDLDAIEGEAAEIIERDPAQAERFFGNRAVAGTGHAFDPDRWDELVSDYRPDDAAFIVLGIDGARFEDELNPDTDSYKNGYKEGVLAMANAGPNTNGSQFFIMLEDNPSLPKLYTIFGKVTKGMDVVHNIVKGDKMTKVSVK